MQIAVSMLKKREQASKAPAVVYFLPESFSAKDLDPSLADCGLDIAAFLKDRAFVGAKGSSAHVVVSLVPKKFTLLIFVGMGKRNEQKHFSMETMRRGVGSAIKCVQAKKISEVAMLLPESSLFGISGHDFIKDMYAIASMAAYKFDAFITKKDAKKTMDIALCAAPGDQKASKDGAQAGAIIAQAVNRARYLNDMPPSQMTPTDLAHEAKTLAKEHGLECTIFDGKKIKELGMLGLHGVALGSDQDPRFVILHYRAKKANAPTLGFVGKGITFDSGGLSIKPANSMETMKDDMAGASAVIQAVAALAQLQADVHVIGFAPISENLLGGSAQKPGDIVTFYNGKTAEVRNTDAEGRLILADALAYATKNFKLDCIVDVATLTGACIYAVGPFYSALVSDNQPLADRIKEAGNRSGDCVWQLPFGDDFKAAIASDIADIQNVGDPRIAAGTITAACFLREFSGDVPWAHLDIASSSFNVPNISYVGKGATGSSVRLLIDLAMHWR